MAEPHAAARRAVNEHYGRPGLGDTILAALRAAGLDPDALTPEDLGPLDHVHLGGLPATLALLRLAALPRGGRVLDVGGGIGGPARTLARALDCHVTVLDLTEEFCRVGADLTRRTGLDDRVVFRHGSALAMPFPEAHFDAAWMQNVAMNIADKGRLFAEIARVLRPAGRLAMQDHVAGPVQPPHYPVPWARDATLSFLVPVEEERALLAAAGLRVVAWQEAAIIPPQRGPQALPSLQQLLWGEQWPHIVANMGRNMAEGRIGTIWAVAERQSPAAG
jgi:SAM-dependent methyltransferase